MKKIATMSILLTLAFASIASASRLEKGSIRLDDGSTVVRIEVGQDNDRDLALRIRRLEQATRDLQNRVYDLEVDGAGREMWTCKAEAFSKVYYGEGATRGQAERRAVEECQKSNHAMHCDIESCSNE